MPKPLWTAKEAAEAVGGKAVGNWKASGLSIDTRSLETGDLFIPLKDARDGHDFIPQARKAGAAAVMSEREDEAAPSLIVNDSMQALQDMALWARDRERVFRIAITGSVGKTSLKDAVAHICATQGITHKSQKSFNNHWGVPFTLATMPREAKYGVFELGMNHAGELAALSPLVSPHVAVISKIAPAHLAHFSSVDDIAAAKSEILEGLGQGGLAVLNADDNYFEFLKAKATRLGLETITFGIENPADVRVIDRVVEPGQLKCRISVFGAEHDLTLKINGLHWFENAACAIAICYAAGIGAGKSIKALQTFSSIPGRGEVLKINLGGHSVNVIDESYNANPESMRSAIDSLSQFPVNRKVAVLGDMFELGPDELSMHASLFEHLNSNNVARVITVGKRMKALYEVLPSSMQGPWCRTWEDALDALSASVQGGDIVLVKGSNAIGLGQLIKTIKNQNTETADVV